MFLKGIWPYGAVDVRDSQGRILHGYVVDTRGKDGLIVDFDYPQHRAVLVPLANFVDGHLSTGSGDPALTVGDTVQVLYQLSPLEPWCWQPATIVEGGSHHEHCAYDYAFVEICMPDGRTVRDTVGWCRVQPTGDMPACHWEKSPNKVPFKRYTVQQALLFPQLLAVTQLPDFKAKWNRMTETIAVDVTERGGVICLAPSKQAALCIQATVASTIYPTGVFGLNALLQNVRKRKREDGTDTTNTSILVGPAKVHAPCARAGFRMHGLPVELLARIFSFLNACERVKASATCSGWNTILKSAPLAAWVEIDTNHCSDEMVAGLVDKMVRPTTRTLVITSIDPKDCCILRPSPIHIVLDILHAKNLKIPWILLASCNIWKSSVLGSQAGECRAELSARWSGVCEKLVLKDTVIGVTWVDREEVAISESTMQKWQSGAFDGFIWRFSDGGRSEWISVHRRKVKIINTQVKRELTVLDLVE
ncbi:uncharacterized protein LOC129592098 [Paramacrobiotus metropolitanus]|uniref:uncharacterized protein LOC129592098 n=1 Tax=Paramacrobiotus metropolitanus TaxID=2943436 RepID=UPI0024464931|nr:uncharacterized protein LOC129592098 [Paramacrobiotus metropolitanus]